jgi:uncharacterized protein (TIGR02246 family)
MITVGRGLLLALLVLIPAQAFSGAAEEADAFFARWKVAYDANDNVAVAKLYATDALLHGTRSRDVTVGREAITKYFTVVVGTGNKVEFREKQLRVINPTTLMAVGFNDFMRHRLRSECLQLLLGCSSETSFCPYQGALEPIRCSLLVWGQT